MVRLAPYLAVSLMMVLSVQSMATIHVDGELRHSYKKRQLSRLFLNAIQNLESNVLGINRPDPAQMGTGSQGSQFSNQYGGGQQVQSQSQPQNQPQNQRGNNNNNQPSSSQNNKANTGRQSVTKPKAKPKKATTEGTAKATKSTAKAMKPKETEEAVKTKAKPKAKTMDSEKETTAKGSSTEATKKKVAATDDSEEEDTKMEEESTKTDKLKSEQTDTDEKTMEKEKVMEKDKATETTSSSMEASPERTSAESSSATPTETPSQEASPTMSTSSGGDEPTPPPSTSSSVAPSSSSYVPTSSNSAEAKANKPTSVVGSGMSNEEHRSVASQPPRSMEQATPTPSRHSRPMHESAIGTPMTTPLQSEEKPSSATAKKDQPLLSMSLPLKPLLDPLLGGSSSETTSTLEGVSVEKATATQSNLASMATATSQLPNSASPSATIATSIASATEATGSSLTSQTPSSPKPSDSETASATPTTSTAFTSTTATTTPTTDYSDIDWLPPTLRLEETTTNTVTKTRTNMEETADAATTSTTSTSRASPASNLPEVIVPDTKATPPPGSTTVMLKLMGIQYAQVCHDPILAAQIVNFLPNELGSAVGVPPSRMVVLSMSDATRKARQVRRNEDGTSGVLVVMAVPSESIEPIKQVLSDGQSKLYTNPNGKISQFIDRSFPLALTNNEGMNIIASGESNPEPSSDSNKGVVIGLAVAATTIVWLGIVAFFINVYKRRRQEKRDRILGSERYPPNEISPPMLQENSLGWSSTPKY
ncbi:uncharacterized protein VTP21DRAFT_11279 [Calcarisporiella thermophila]|uniref:uncharacterized protein n=1 Tax=Calcarisporiella thermophila TaxID=911321 RepID=UPI003742C67C